MLSCVFFSFFNPFMLKVSNYMYRCLYTYKFTILQLDIKKDRLDHNSYQSLVLLYTADISFNMLADIPFNMLVGGTVVHGWHTIEHVGQEYCCTRLTYHWTCQSGVLLFMTDIPFNMLVGGTVVHGWHTIEHVGQEYWCSWLTYHLTCSIS